jgi:lysozyme
MRRALAFVLLVGCVAREPGIDVEEEALRVCHTQTVEGIDISSYEGAIDWNTVHASGREFGFARIGDGLYLDASFATHWAGIRAAGMIRGAYILFRPTEDVAMQAQHVANAVGVLGDGDLPVTMDIECMCPFSTTHACDNASPGCATPAQAAAALQQMIDLVQASTHKRPMIYTSARVWDGASYYASVAHQPQSALWAVWYLSGCVTLPMDWTDWQFWQYGDGTCGTACDAGVVPGVSTGASCDRDRWNGTLDSLRAFASTDGTIGGDAGVSDDAATTSDAGSSPSDAAIPTDAIVSHDAFVAPFDGPHVDIVRPGDATIATPRMQHGCGCGFTRSTSAPWLALIAAALISRRVFERRSRRAAEQQLPKRLDVA